MGTPKTLRPDRHADIYVGGLAIVDSAHRVSQITWLGMTFNTGYPYLLGVLVLMYVGATIKDVPYSAWGAELAQGYNERTLVMSWKEAFTVTGSLIGAMTPAVIVFWDIRNPPITSIF